MAYTSTDYGSKLFSFVYQECNKNV